MERLQKVIAQSGLCSRRKAEELIKAGLVRVNGKVVDELGTKVSAKDDIEVRGKLLEKEEKIYYVLNKPKGCMSTCNDEHDRKTVLDYLPNGKRVYPVGRLDYDTSGVLLLTNDGEFTNAMTHPKYHIPKVYEVNLEGILSPEDIKKLAIGLKTDEGRYAPAEVLIREKDYTRGRTQLDLTIYEGRNHQVKKMMEALGHRVRKLNRKSFGGVEVTGLRPGQYRLLKPFEYKMLLKQAKESAK